MIINLLISILVNFVPIILAIILHEIAHGYVAYLCGDDTAKRYGRLSLNPVKHIDLFGSLALPLILLLSKTGFVFGWAKPVPVNFSKLRRPKRDMLFVASAGIFANLSLAFISGLLLQMMSFVDDRLFQGIMTLFLMNMVIFNIVLAVFNILPIPPLDGSKILLGWSNNYYIQKYLNSDRQGIVFVILIAFVLPMLLRSLGFDFNPFGWYMIKTSQFLTSLFL